MSPRPDVSKERKNQILDAATEVFSKKGFQKARMDDIAEEAKLGKGTLYWYFKSKESIVIQIFDRIFYREAEELIALVDSPLTATEKINRYAERVIKDVNNLLKFAPVAFEFLSLAFRNKFFKKAFKKYFQDYMQTLLPIIHQGIESGEFREIDAEEAAIALGAIFEGTLLLWVYDTSLVDPSHHIRAGVQLLLNSFTRLNSKDAG
jgi:TetR/AcrR family transcriptional regulator